jgi:lysophospholipase L1-like esterase
MRPTARPDLHRNAGFAFPIVLFATIVGSVLSCAHGLVAPSDKRIEVMGRADRSDPKRIRFGYPGVTVRLAFDGTSIAARVASTTANSRLAVIVDGDAPRVIRLPAGESTIELAAQLPPRPHTIDIVHRTETWQAIVTLRGFVLSPSGALRTPAPLPTRHLVFIGDSVTCGEAIDRDNATTSTQAPTADAACTKDTAAASNGYLSYGMLLGRALNAQVHLVCYGGRGLVRDWRGNTRVANAPQFFDLAVVDPPARAPFDHSSYLPDAVFVSLGTNDFNLELGAFPVRDTYVAAYVTFVRAIRARAPHAHIFLTEGAIVNDETDPARPQKTVLRDDIAETARLLADPLVHVVPSTHYAGDSCNPHPTRDQHAAMAKDFEPYLRQALGW